MEAYKLTKEERETVYRISEADKEWDCWTFSQTTVDLWKRQGYDVKKDHQGGWFTRIPKGKIKPRRKVSKEWSPERKKAASERMRRVLLTPKTR